jgi:hypothetical protein
MRKQYNKKVYLMKVKPPPVFDNTFSSPIEHVHQHCLPCVEFAPWD